MIVLAILALMLIFMAVGFIAHVIDSYAAATSFADFIAKACDTERETEAWL
jgi:Tfp pilus assembly protein FimT